MHTHLNGPLKPEHLAADLHYRKPFDQIIDKHAMLVEEIYVWRTSREGSKRLRMLAEMARPSLDELETIAILGLVRAAESDQSPEAARRASNNLLAYIKAARSESESKPRITSTTSLPAPSNSTKPNPVPHTRETTIRHGQPTPAYANHAIGSLPTGSAVGARDRTCSTLCDMFRVLLFSIVAAALVSCGTSSSHSLKNGSDMAWADGRDVAAAARVATRREDWRCGAVVYQVFVDRFAPPDKDALAAKKHLYSKPRRLMKWTDPPRPGRKNKAAGLWSHELHFWGGDLSSLRTKLDHVESLGADVLYLNPIHAAYTNHKYDAQDFFDVSPEYGTREDVAALATDLHDRGMRLMLDGVFNHMGATSPHFIEAKDDPDSPWRNWFIFNDDGSHQGWYDVANLPEVNLESPAVRARLWGDADSVVRGYLDDGVDGWRLDVAYDLGPVLLDELVESARLTKPDAWIVGEIWNYPRQWAPPLDGVMNFHVREILMAMADGRIEGGRAGTMIASMIDDCGIEHALRSWLILDNHDTDRLASWSRDDGLTQMLVTLHMTLPGCPVIYYGSELGMTGVGDPGCRAPMRWDLATADNDALTMWRNLLALRESHPALRWGDFVGIEAGSLLAFARETDKVGETVIVLANPSARAVDETFALPLGKVMPGDLEDLVETDAPPAHIRGGVVRIEVPAKSVRVLRPRTEPWQGGYTSYGRVH